MNTDNEFDMYYSGEKLYGDDFCIEDITKWYMDEQEAYTNMYVRTDKYRYGFHALNSYHGFSKLPKKKFQEVLGLGAATGAEFLPIIDAINKLVITEPSDFYDNITDINGVSVKYVKPQLDGSLEFEAKTFDLITSFGVLHHIANVSHVIRECSKTLKSGGYMLIREPIISMGDWKHPRPGLTKRERGIPLQILLDIIEDSQMKVEYQALCFFSPTNRIMEKIGINPFGTNWLVILDYLLSNIFWPNYSYHATSFIKKIRPSCVYLVVKKSPY